MDIKTNEVRCTYGRRIQWLIKCNGDWNIGCLVLYDEENIMLANRVLVQPYSGGPPVFVEQFSIRDQPHEETKDAEDIKHAQHMAEVDAKLEQAVKEIDEGTGNHEERIRDLELDVVLLRAAIAELQPKTMTPAEWVTKTLNDRPPTALCPACGNPLSDELVRKLKAPEFAKQAFMCPGCMEVLLTKGLIYV